MANLVQGTQVSVTSAAEPPTLPAMPVRLKLKGWQGALLESGNGGNSGSGGNSGPSGGGPSGGSGDPGSGGEGGSPSTEG
jgi:hypothetical protein